MLTSTTLRCSRNNKWVIKHVNHTSLPQSKKRLGNPFSDGNLFLGLNPARFYIIIHTYEIDPSDRDHIRGIFNVQDENELTCEKKRKEHNYWRGGSRGWLHMRKRP